MAKPWLLLRVILWVRMRSLSHSSLPAVVLFPFTPSSPLLNTHVWSSAWSAPSASRCFPTGHSLSGSSAPCWGSQHSPKSRAGWAVSGGCSLTLLSPGTLPLLLS